MQNLSISTTPAVVTDAVIVSLIVTALTSAVTLLVEGERDHAEQACLYAAELLPLISDSELGVATSRRVELVSRIATLVSEGRSPHDD